MAFSIIHLALLIVVIAGVVGIVYVVLRQCGVSIPHFITQILWILLAVILGIFAIKFIASML